MRVLQRAAEVLGGVEELRLCLDVSPARLDAWMQGLAKPPDAVLLRLADALADRSLSALPGSGAAAEEKRPS